MFNNKIKIIFIIFILYQTPLYSKSNSFDNLDSKQLSKYFSGIVALQNKDNSVALDFFNSSKVLINKHDLYLKRYIYSLVLENKVSQAINLVKNNKNKTNTNFFDVYLLLILDSLKKNDYEQAAIYLKKTARLAKSDRFNLAISESLKQYIHVFKENKILNNKNALSAIYVINKIQNKL